ncbi:uncharacterized protein BDR25DRAFT_362548 [Lindgomyces ingoldianus]|uniref:Uncharacterized protein n=1 Tax=Lindgomyces ingoldianus TaxID=673940 RepID=A0ACB6QA04_9PLEO|nr:uncharacterized protein BDR25DRAFT_362548 [Lindgomyces ingoldianus]KAF2463749.1 hypothetical protein BDR25DRAFT_362548 [Lindgomyces ingoldianus]
MSTDITGDEQPKVTTGANGKEQRGLNGDGGEPEVFEAKWGQRSGTKPIPDKACELLERPRNFPKSCTVLHSIYSSSHEVNSVGSAGKSGTRDPFHHSRYLAVFEVATSFVRYSQVLISLQSIRYSSPTLLLILRSGQYPSGRCQNPFAIVIRYTMHTIINFVSRSFFRSLTLLLLLYISFTLGQYFVQKQIDGCQYSSLTWNTYLYFSDPLTPKVHYSIRTQFIDYYPRELTKALSAAGFNLIRAPPESDPQAICQWHDGGKVKKGGWTRGYITFKGAGDRHAIDKTLTRIADILRTHRPSRDLVEVGFLIASPFIAIILALILQWYCVHKCRNSGESDTTSVDVELTSMKSHSVPDLPVTANPFRVKPNHLRLDEIKARDKAPPSYSGGEDLVSVHSTQSIDFDLASMKTGENYSISIASSSKSGSEGLAFCILYFNAWFDAIGFGWSYHGVFELSSIPFCSFSNAKLAGLACTSPCSASRPCPPWYRSLTYRNANTRPSHQAQKRLFKNSLLFFNKILLPSLPITQSSLSVCRAQHSIMKPLLCTLAITATTTARGLTNLESPTGDVVVHATNPPTTTVDVNVGRHRRIHSHPNEYHGELIMPASPQAYAAPTLNLEEINTELIPSINSQQRESQRRHLSHTHDSSEPTHKIPAHTSWSNLHKLPAQIEDPGYAGLVRTKAQGQAQRCTATATATPAIESRARDFNVKRWITSTFLSTAASANERSSYTKYTPKCTTGTRGSCIYFTLAYTNSTYFTTSPPNNGNNNGISHIPIFYIDTPWILTYAQKLSSALFNNATTSSTCPKGNCKSCPIPIPGSPDIHLLRLNSTAQQVLETTTVPVTYNTLLVVSKTAVQRGRLAVLSPAPNQGFSLDSEKSLLYLPVLTFIEDKLTSVYPTLEIGLILGFLLPIPAAIAGFFGAAVLGGEIVWSGKGRKGAGAGGRGDVRAWVQLGLARCRLEMEVWEVWGAMGMWISSMAFIWSGLDRSLGR